MRSRRRVPARGCRVPDYSEVVSTEPVIESLRKAVEAMPDDVPLRLHLATMLLQAGQRDEAVRHLGAVLQRDPANADALRLLSSEQKVVPPAQPDATGSQVYDWSQAENELRDVVPVMFVGDSDDAGLDEADEHQKTGDHQRHGGDASF